MLITVFNLFSHQAHELTPPEPVFSFATDRERADGTSIIVAVLKIV
jgi:hypothetical protein